MQMYQGLNISQFCYGDKNFTLLRAPNIQGLPFAHAVYYRLAVALPLSLTSGPRGSHGEPHTGFQRYFLEVAYHFCSYFIE